MLVGLTILYWLKDGSYMQKQYTEIWNDFQIVSPTYLDEHLEPYEFDLVKWQYHDPIEVLDLKTGKKKLSSKHCFTVGTLVWDPKEAGFSFKSCGLRYLRHRKEGLEDFILTFCKDTESKLSGD
jgi:hypothetical protein